jgi:transcriptional regulator with XRE-family HTH domain
MIEETKKYLGERIQEIRKKRGLKQSELAEMIDIDSKHISKIECGYSYPSIDLLDKLARVFEVNPAAFFEIEHLKSKDDLISEITTLLKNSTETEVKTIYRITKDIIQ